MKIATLVFALVFSSLASASSASDTGYSAEDAVLYRNLLIPGTVSIYSTGSLRHAKSVGRLTCTKVMARQPSLVVVGYTCSLGEEVGEGYQAGDELIFKAMNARQVPVARGVNLLVYTKTLGNLVCSRLYSQANKMTVGYTCSYNSY